MEMTLVLSQQEIIIRLFAAVVLGMALGVERTLAGKTAGMRTYALVSLGAAAFIIVSLIVGEWYLERTTLDPLRVASQIVVGIGFIGGGIIIFRGFKLQGLTTAAGLWVAAGIGMASGFGLYGVAISVAVATLLVFTILWYVEQKVVKRVMHENGTPLADHEDDML